MRKQQPKPVTGEGGRCYEPFRFKRFSVEHSQSAIRVGVDGVLVGAWVDTDGLPPDGLGLDAGCGCGMIALMLAQRWPKGNMIGMDIHEPSVKEAIRNVESSPWGNRVRILHGDVTGLDHEQIGGELSLIVSNPPFFAAGITDPATPRLVARHACEFGPLTLPAIGEKLLHPEGRLALIAPACLEQEIRIRSKAHGLTVRRSCRVITVEGKEPSRVMMELEKSDSVPEWCQTLVIHDVQHRYTPEYMRLTKDFYLKF